MTHEALFTTSLAVAFVSGIVALFAPCCISFLLPTYIGQIFQTRIKIILGTIYFALGIATIMLPVALGFRLILTLFNDYHLPVYSVGGILMILMGIFFIGKVKLPMIPTGFLTKNKSGYWAIYLLGIASGLASSCCAPVLIAAVSLTAITPTTGMAILIALTYVFGMVTPLLLGAILLSDTPLRIIRQKMNNPIKKFGINWGDLISGIVMILAGIIILFYAVNGDYAVSGLQEDYAQKIYYFTANINERLVGVTYWNYIVPLILLLFIWVIIKQLKKEKND